MGNDVKCLILLAVVAVFFITEVFLWQLQQQPGPLAAVCWSSSCKTSIQWII